MDKVVLLTNFYSWYLGMPSKIRKRVNWEKDSYPNNKRPITKCVTDKDDRIILQPVDDLSAEGCYLVFDMIRLPLLKALFDDCEQKKDQTFVLFHSQGCFNRLNNFEQWRCLFPYRGMHEEGWGNSYQPVFDRLTDSEGDKLNRIINSVFMPLVIHDFTDKCLVPNKRIELVNLPSYHILCEQGFRNELDAFLNKYESCQSSSEYAEDWDRLNELLRELVKNNVFLQSETTRQDNAVEY